MLRKFPMNNAFMNPGQMGQMGQMGFPPNSNFNPPQQQNFDINQMDDAAKKDFFGERLYSKITINPHYQKFSELFYI